MAKTAFIDLTSRSIRVEATPPEMLDQYLGSRGYAARLLYDRVGPEVEPFSSQNLLIFSTGPLTGSPWPTGARYTVTAKSPLTGGVRLFQLFGIFRPGTAQGGVRRTGIPGAGA